MRKILFLLITVLCSTAVIHAKTTQQISNLQGSDINRNQLSIITSDRIVLNDPNSPPTDKLNFVSEDDNDWEYIGKGYWYDLPYFIDSQGNDLIPDGWSVDFYQSLSNQNCWKAYPYKSEDAIEFYKEVVGYEILDSTPVYIYKKNNENKFYIPEYKFTTSFYKDKTLTITCVSPNPETGYSNYNAYGYLKSGKLYFDTGLDSNNRTKGLLFNYSDEPNQRYYFNESVPPLIIQLPILKKDNHGLFVGIRTFNDNLSYFPIRNLSEDNLYEFKDFVNKQVPGKGTLLYASAERCLDNLSTYNVPENTKLVSMLTFTDGLDEGSLSKNYYPEYKKDEVFAEHLKQRISEFKIPNLPDCKFESYVIGLKGKDVYDDELFEINLESLASSEDKKMEVSDFNDVTTMLTSLIKTLTHIEKNKNFNLSVPALADEKKVRFTFDKITNIEDSKYWLEGTYSMDRNQLENIVYNGFTSTTGNTAKATYSGNNLVFTFNDCRDTNGKIFDFEAEDVQEWKYIDRTDKWQPNSEFDGKGSIIDIPDYSSVVLLLNLDCSTSLGDRFYELIEVINDLLETLATTETNEVISIEQDDIVDYSDAPVFYYNIQGLQVTNPSKGIYLRRQGNKVSKILIP